MLFSKAYIPTLKEAPQDAEAASHKLLVRAGYVRKSGAGAYMLLPMGYKVMNKLEAHIKDRLSTEDNQEVFFTSAVRNSAINENANELFKILGSELFSYKQLPKSFFGITEAGLNDIRPRLGLLFPKNFRRLSGISIAGTTEDIENINIGLLDLLYQVFEVFKLKALKVEGISRNCTGKIDNWFLITHENGEHTTVVCNKCNNRQLTDSYPSNKVSGAPQEMQRMERIHTPNAKTIEELTKFFDCTADKFVKTLLYMGDGQLIAALVRGDRELSEVKLKEAAGVSELIMADAETVKKATSAEVGFAGPVGLKARVIADYEVVVMQNFLVGANQTDYHLINVNIDRDFEYEASGDIRCAADGDVCPVCGERLKFEKGFILGSVHLFDKKFMQGQELYYRDSNGSNEPTSGLYFSINLYTLLAAIVEQNHDEAGLLLPQGITPFDAEIVVVNAKDESQMAAGEKLYKMAIDIGIDVLMDDRDERAGVKFKDCELIGIPQRITVGKRAAEGIVEYKDGRNPVVELPMEEVITRLLKCCKGGDL